MKKLLSIIITLSMLFSPLSGLAVPESPAPARVRELIERVNDFWISSHKSGLGYSWENAAYYVGNNEAYFTTGIEAYLEYSIAFGNKNAWKGNGENDRSKWNNGNVYHADNQTCFQTYADLYNLDGDVNKIARALDVVGTQITTDNTDYWWWCDALFMAMPVFTKLYRITGDELYGEKLYEYFKWCRELLYDSESKLFFRDKGYISSRVQGEKNFWARGNGWVIAGLVKVLDEMPETWEHYDYFKTTFLEMADAIANCQKVDSSGNGYWTQSMLPKYPVSENNPDGYETSGTAFMTYGLLYGINSGLLTEEKYLNSAIRGYNYLKNVAINEMGAVGYCQEIGSAATSATVQGKTQPYGTGAALLALCEMYRFTGGMTEDLYPYVQRKMNNSTAMMLGSPYMYANGKVIEMAGVPIVKDERTLAPLRAVSEALGFSVTWNEEQRCADISSSGRTVTITEGSRTIYINGGAIQMDVSAEIIDGSMYIPVRHIAEALGKTVGYDNGTIYIGYKERVFNNSERYASDLLNNILLEGKLPERQTQSTRTFKIAIPELENKSSIKISSAIADKTPEPENPVENAFDGDLGSRYAAIEPTAVFDLGEVKYVEGISVAFWQNESRITYFELEVSTDGTNYTSVFSGNSTLGKTFDNINVGQNIRYIRYKGNGNSTNNWSSLLEIIPYGK